MNNNNQNVFFFYPEGKEGEPRRVIAGLFDEESNTLKFGKSECSVKDRFNKAKGRAIALGRANCDRPFKIKQFVQKGNIVRTNQDLAPIEVRLTEEVTKPVLHQFIEIAKTL